MQCTNAEVEIRFGICVFSPAMPALPIRFEEFQAQVGSFVSKPNTRCCPFRMGQMMCRPQVQDNSDDRNRIQ